MGQNAKAEEPTLENLREAFKITCMFGYYTALKDFKIKVDKNKQDSIELLCVKLAQRTVNPKKND